MAPRAAQKATVEPDDLIQPGQTDTPTPFDDGESLDGLISPAGPDDGLFAAGDGDDNEEDDGEDDGTGDGDGDDNEEDDGPVIDVDAQPLVNSKKRNRRATKKSTKWSNVRKAFPAPAVRHFREDNSPAHGKPAKFWEYWAKLYANPSFRDRITVYIYRMWPILKEKKRQVAKAYQPFDIDDLAKLYGCGDYHMKLNDMGNRSSTMAICTVKNVGSRNLSEFPPILDMDALDLDDPLNTSYVKWCRTRGIKLPNDEGYQEEENSMANATVVKDMVEAYAAQSDKMINMSDDARQRAEEEARRLKMEKERTEREAKELREKAEKADPVAPLQASMQVMREASSTASSIVQKGLDRALEMSKRDQEGGNIKDAILLVKEMMGTNQSASIGSEVEKIIDKLMKRDEGYAEKIFALQEGRIKAMEALLERQATAPPPVTAVAVAPKSLKEQLEEMKDVKDSLRDILGIDGEGEDKKTFMDYLPQILQGVTLFGTVVASVMHNMAVARTGQGAPAPVPPPENILTPEQVMAAQQGAQGLHPNSYAAHQHQQQQYQQPQQTGGESSNAMARFTGFLKMIEIPLVKSFTDGETGAEFAAKLMELADNGMFGPGANGRQIYDAVIEYGEPVIGSLMRTHPPIWDVVKTAPDKWVQFLHEFCTADEIWEREDLENERALNVVQNPTATASAQGDVTQPVDRKLNPR